MRLGVFTVPYSTLPLEQALDRLAEMGVDAVELGTGNYPGSAHCDPDVLLDDEPARRALRSAVESRGMIISALSQHGNPLHPDPAIAGSSHETWKKTVRLASLLEVAVVNAFSGCPGSDEAARQPNWVTCWWPPEYSELLEWQWSERVIPYWQAEGAFAESEGVRLAFEMHPGFVVYNPESLLRLREAVGPVIGANFDPSHLFWQGIDPVEAIKLVAAAGALYHVHAKDTYLDRSNVARNGVLDTKPFNRFLDRSWSFRTVGYGQPEKTWRDIVSALRTVGYDYVMSIEHEDGLLSIDEGMLKAVEFLRGILFTDAQTEMWWVSG
jgi:sugar phosphate isomerase/epimerase